MNAFEPIAKVIVQQILQPEYGRVRGEIEDYHRREFYQFYVYDTLYNVWRLIDLSQEQLRASKIVRPEVDMIWSILLADLANPKQIWSVLRTFFPVAESERNWKIISLFNGGYVLESLKKPEETRSIGRLVGEAISKLD